MMCSFSYYPRNTGWFCYGCVQKSLSRSGCSRRYVFIWQCLLNIWYKLDMKLLITNMFVHVRLCCAVLFKSVLWIDWMQIHSLQLPVVKFVLYCTFCNFVIHDLVISYSWPWKYGLMRLLAWREMMMMTMKMTTKLQLFLDIKILAVTPTLPSAENDYLWVGF